MDSKYINTRIFIQSKSPSFERFLSSTVGILVWKVLQWMCTQTDVYIFSGVIRNYFLGRLDCRDLDIVVKSLAPLKELLDISPSVHKNQFGGYKIKYSFIEIDIWELDKTWGIQAKNMKSTPESLVNSAFFNFSGILYNLNKHCFIISEPFCYFFNTKEMDLILEDNPCPELCIVNTFYYEQKYSFKISHNLKKWIIREYCNMQDKQRLIRVQIHHYSKIYFNLNEIERKIIEFV